MRYLRRNFVPLLVVVAAAVVAVASVVVSVDRVRDDDERNGCSASAGRRSTWTRSNARWATSTSMTSISRISIWTIWTTSARCSKRSASMTSVGFASSPRG